MAQRTAVVGARTGLHARPAAMFVAAAGAQAVPVTIRTADKPAVPARSLLSVLSLGATYGTEVILEADGDGAEAALDALATLVARDLDADQPASPPDPANTDSTGAGDG